MSKQNAAGAAPQENKMGVLPVGKLLAGMAVPMMISMLVQALYNIVDSVFVSRLSENAFNAVGLAFPLQSLMIAVGAGTAVGINALLSRSLGEKKQEMADRAAGAGIFLLPICCYLVFAFIGLFLSRPFFVAQAKAVPEIVEYGVQYTRICLGLSVGIFSQFCFLSDGSKHTVCVCINLSSFYHFFYNSTQSACTVKFFHGIYRMIWVNGTDQRDFTADGIESLRGNIKSHLSCQCRNMQQTVGRTAGRHHIADYILQTLLGHKITWAFLFFHSLHYFSGCFFCHLMPFLTLASYRRISMWGKSQDLCHGTHSIGSSHKRTCSRSWTCMANNSFVFFSAHVAFHISCISLLCVGQCQHTVLIAACCHITTGKHCSWNVHSECSHKHTRHYLVTGSHNDHSL